MTANLPDWLRPTTSVPAVERTVRVAFLGRTSTDEQQDPTLSLPRQLTNCQRALLPGMVIVAHFYDVESSRKELSQRGRSTAWEKFDIDIPRDGGLADLLAEATTPGRRFDVVICESIDRIARWTHQGTKIEYDLELAGVPLLAADEPIMLGGQSNGRKRKRASQVLLRRTKQGVAEWYILEMLEKSWDGFEIHTVQGWNTGKPPYGYMAEKHRHPVPARRTQGKHKTKLAIDPARGPVVEQIYLWRVDEKLAYRAIADRLNTDLDRYPPPQPADPNGPSAGGPAPPSGKSYATRSTPGTWCGTAARPRTSSTPARTTGARSGSCRRSPPIPRSSRSNCSAPPRASPNIAAGHPRKAPRPTRGRGEPIRCARSSGANSATAGACTASATPPGRRTTTANPANATAPTATP